MKQNQNRFRPARRVTDTLRHHRRFSTKLQRHAAGRVVYRLPVNVTFHRRLNLCFRDLKVSRLTPPYLALAETCIVRKSDQGIEPVTMPTGQISDWLSPHQSIKASHHAYTANIGLALNTLVWLYSLGATQTQYQNMHRAGGGYVSFGLV